MEEPVNAQTSKKRRKKKEDDSIVWAVMEVKDTTKPVSNCNQYDTCMREKCSQLVFFFVCVCVRERANILHRVLFTPQVPIVDPLSSIETLDNSAATFLKIPAEYMAEQMTLIEEELFSKIRPLELVTQGWMKKNNDGWGQVMQLLLSCSLL